MADARDLSEGPGLQDFMGGLEVEEPDWIHIKTDRNHVDPPVDIGAVREAVIDNLMLVEDPEIPINIYDLGLIYDLDVSADGSVRVLMTLTAPNCPVAGSLPEMVRKGVLNVPGTTGCEVDLTWDPPWSPEKASEDARLALGF